MRKRAQEPDAPGGNSCASGPAPALPGQSVDDFPPLTPDAAAAALLTRIGCPVDLLVLSVVAEEPGEEPGSLKVAFRLPVAAPDDLEVHFEWTWSVEGYAESEGEPADEPSGEWRIGTALPVRKELLARRGFPFQSVCSILDVI